MQDSNEQKVRFATSVSVSDAETLDQIDFKLFDFVVVGDPFCRWRKNNPLRDGKSMDRAFELLKQHRNKIVFTLPVAPVESELPYVEDLLSRMKAGAHWAEVHSAAMARKVFKEFPSIHTFFGCFANVHTNLTAEIFTGYKCRGGVLPCELDLEEIELINNSIRMGLFIPVFGRFPIAFSQYCMFNPQAYKIPIECENECEEGTVVDFGGDRKVLHRGRVIYSYKTLSMFEHLEMLIRKGFRNFRIEGHLLSGEQINRAGTLLREHIRAIAEEKTPPSLNRELLEIAPEGLCNGFYFQKRGMDYLNRRMQVVDSMDQLIPKEDKEKSGKKKTGHGKVMGLKAVHKPED